MASFAPFRFSGHSSRLDSPGRNAQDVTPSDSQELQNYSRALYFDAGGSVSLIPVNQSTAVSFIVQDGTLLPIEVKQVRSTGTTAAGIKAIW